MSQSMRQASSSTGLCRGCSAARHHYWWPVSHAAGQAANQAQHTPAASCPEDPLGAIQQALSASQRNCSKPAAVAAFTCSVTSRGNRRCSAAGALPAMQQATPGVQRQLQHPPAASHPDGTEGGALQFLFWVAVAHTASNPQRPTGVECPPAASAPEWVLGSWSEPALALDDTCLSRKSNRVGGGGSAVPSWDLPFLLAACCCWWWRWSGASWPSESGCCAPRCPLRRGLLGCCCFCRRTWSAIRR